MQSLWMVAASFLFAAMGVCVKLAADDFSASEIVFYRSVVALLLTTLLMRARGIAFATPCWRQQAYRGASGFASLLLYFYAITLLPLATAVTLNYTSPLFLAVYFAVFSGMRLRLGMLLALAVGFLGVVAVLQPTLREDQWLGGLVALGSGVISGLAYFNVRQLGARGEPETRTVFYFSLFSTLCSALWMLFHEFHPVHGRGGLLLLGVGGFATLAQLCMTRAYKRGAPIVAAALAYTTIIFASLFGVAIWQEVLPLTAWAGIALIVASGVAAARLGAAAPRARMGEPRYTESNR